MTVRKQIGMALVSANSLLLLALAFLKSLDHDIPAELDWHLIIENYATHQQPKVKAWLAQHPRFRLHFTPTSSS